MKLLRRVPVMVAAAVLLLACSGDSGYPDDLADDAYPLRAMLPRASELPFAMDACPLASDPVAQAGRQLETASCTAEFDNAQWATLFDVEDLEAKQRQLEAVGRVNNALALLTWESPFAHLGEPSSVTLQSTLYEDVDDAVDALSGLCGLPLDDSLAVNREPFWLETIADDATGFTLSQEVENFGTMTDTVVCFRTGRIVHAVDINGFGSESSIFEAVTVAEIYRDAVDAAFDGL